LENQIPFSQNQKVVGMEVDSQKEAEVDDREVRDDAHGVAVVLVGKIHVPFLAVALVPHNNLEDDPHEVDDNTLHLTHHQIRDLGLPH